MRQVRSRALSANRSLRLVDAEVYELLLKPERILAALAKAKSS
jgi:hypothetical protein